MRTPTVFLPALLLVSALALTGCSASPSPEPAKSPISASAEETETESEPTDPVGSRANPLPVGQVLAFGAGSAFQVGASGKPQTTPTYSVLPLTIQIDWASIKIQFPDEQSPALTPWTNFMVSFVTAAGKSYTTMDDYSVDTGVSLIEIGDVYEGTDVVQTFEAISVPEAEIADGTWVVENVASGDKVFIAAE